MTTVISIVQIAAGIFLIIWGILKFLAVAARSAKIEQETLPKKEKLRLILSIVMFAVGMALLIT
jgi:uncharacterized protein YjeT (DUF2065 family)